MKKRKLRTLSACLMLICVLLPMLIGLVSCISVTKIAGANNNLTDTESNLPVVYLTTDSGRNPGRDDNDRYMNGTFRLQLNDYYASCQNAYTGENALHMGIRTRGNSTRLHLGVTKTGKYSYKVKLSEKANMFGFGESKDWILLSNLYDLTNMRNTTAYQLARYLGLEYCDSTWVTLYLNGEYRGLYQFCEAIDVSSKRVDITDWGDIVEDVARAIALQTGMSESDAKALEKRMKTDMRWVTSGKFEGYTISDYYRKSFDITSGYLIEYDTFAKGEDTRPYLFPDKYTPAGVKLKIDTPEYTYTNPEMLEYVRQVVLDFEEALLSDDFCTKDGRHYSELCDMNFLVDFWLLQTIVKNGEIGIRSMFFYIENGKICWSPVWDFDHSSGNSIIGHKTTSGWYGLDDDRNHWFRALYKDPYFLTLVQNRYADLRPALEVLLDGMDVYRDYIEQEALRDYEKYGKRFFVSEDRMSEDYLTEADFYRDWQRGRIEWMDTYLIKRGKPIGDTTFSNKSTFTLMYGESGDTLPKDNLTQYGVRSNYLYVLGSGENLRFRLTNRHSTEGKVKMYINGKFYAEYGMGGSNNISGTIKASDMNLNIGSRNCIHFAYYDETGALYERYYSTVLVSDINNVSLNEVVVQINGDINIYHRNSDVVLPEAPSETRKGLRFLGWTDGEVIYTAGTTTSFNSNTYLYEKWIQIDLNAAYYTDYTEIIYGNEVWVGDISYNKNEVRENKPPKKEEPVVVTVEKDPVSSVIFISAALLIAVFAVGSVGYAIGSGAFKMPKRDKSKKKNRRKKKNAEAEKISEISESRENIESM